MEVLFISSSGPAAADHFAPTLVVGNVIAGDPAAAQAAPFQYVPDPGDGTGIAAALAAVPAGGGWVHIRRGTYTLAAGVLPLTLPSGCRVTGDGPGATILVARADDRRVFAVGVGAANCELSEIGFTLPAAAVGAAGLTMIDTIDGQHVRLVNLHVHGPGTAFSADESLTSVIRADLDTLVQQCRISAMPHTPNASLACIRIAGSGHNSRILENFVEGSDYQIFADGSSGAANRLQILHNECLADESVNTCIALAVGGVGHFVRGNQCIGADIGISYSADDGHVSENRCSAYITSPIVLNGSGVICIGNSLNGGAVVIVGIGNVVAHNV